VVTVEGFSAQSIKTPRVCVQVGEGRGGHASRLLQDSTMMNLAANHLEGTRVVLTIHSNTHHLHPQILDADPQSK
jgi:hypothetical protein